MNKYQDALDDLEFKAIQHENTLKGTEWDDCAIEVQNDVEALKKLVDRATPMKSRYEHAPEPSKAYKYDCPVCGCFLSMNYKIKEWKYCPECGQALDWSNEE